MKKILLVVALCSLFAGCGKKKYPVITWAMDTIVVRSGHYLVNMTYPVAVGGRVADSINWHIARALTADVYHPSPKSGEFTTRQAVDDILRKDTEEMQRMRREKWSGMRQERMFRERANRERMNRNPMDTMRMRGRGMSNQRPMRPGQMTSMSMNTGEASMIDEIRSTGKVCILNGVASEYLETYLQVDGEPGITTVHCLNIDRMNGRLLTRDQLIRDTVGLKDLNREAFKVHFERMGADMSFDSLFVRPDELPLPKNIGLDPNGLLMVYNPGEIAPESLGQLSYAIPYVTARAVMHRIAK